MSSSTSNISTKAETKLTLMDLTSKVLLKYFSNIIDTKEIFKRIALEYKIADTEEEFEKYYSTNTNSFMTNIIIYNHYMPLTKLLYSLKPEREKFLINYFINLVLKILEYYYTSINKGSNFKGDVIQDYYIVMYGPKLVFENGLYDDDMYSFNLVDANNCNSLLRSYSALFESMFIPWFTNSGIINYKDLLTSNIAFIELQKYNSVYTNFQPVRIRNTMCKFMLADEISRALMDENIKSRDIVEEINYYLEDEYKLTPIVEINKDYCNNIKIY